MNITDSLITRLSENGIFLDKDQEKFLNALNQNPLYKKSSHGLLTSKQLPSIYLYGNVGRGKTMILKEVASLFYKKINFFHYIDFIELIHHMMRDKKLSKNPLMSVSKNIRKKYEFIFIDEFQIEDIADAMIIGKVLYELNRIGTKFAITSNSSLDNLYKDGLQREKFIKSVSFIKNDFLYYELKGALDYRIREIIDYESNSLDKYSLESVQRVISKTFKTDNLHREDIEVNSRTFSCLGKSDTFIWLSFKDFFSSPTSSKDFKSLIDRFHWIILSDFVIQDDTTADSVRRFISFLDIAYVKKSKVKFFYPYDHLRTLYTGEILIDLWQRASSRISEMVTKEYLYD